MSFVKTEPAPLEAAGLRWLADAGARVPAIIEDSPRRLVLTRIASGRLDADGEEDLARMLAGWHGAGAPHVGPLPAAGRFFVGRCELDSPLDATDDWNASSLQYRCLPPPAPVGLTLAVRRTR